MQLSQYLAIGLPKYESECDGMLGDNSVLGNLFGRILIQLRFIYTTSVHHVYTHFIVCNIKGFQMFSIGRRPNDTLSHSSPNFKISNDLGIVVPSSVVYSHTCNATALTNISTHVSPHAWLNPTMNATSHVPTRTCGLMLPTYAHPWPVPNVVHLFPSSTPSSACTQFVHIPYRMGKMIMTPLPKLM